MEYPDSSVHVVHRNKLYFTSAHNPEISSSPRFRPLWHQAGVSSSQGDSLVCLEPCAQGISAGHSLHLSRCILVTAGGRRSSTTKERPMPPSIANAPCSRTRLRQHRNSMDPIRMATQGWPTSSPRRRRPDSRKHPLKLQLHAVREGA